MSSFAGILVRKMFRSLAFIGVLIYVIVVLVRRIPGGFVPEEDQGTSWSTPCCRTRRRSSAPTP